MVQQYEKAKKKIAILVGRDTVNRIMYGILTTHSTQPKETTLERADIALQFPLFAEAEKERKMFTIFFLSILYQLMFRQIPSSSDQES